MTLANGTYAGQRKTIVGVAGYGGGNTSVITPATPDASWATITLDTAREYAELEWDGANWWVIHTTGAIA